MNRTRRLPRKRVSPTVAFLLLLLSPLGLTSSSAEECPEDSEAFKLCEGTNFLVPRVVLENGMTICDEYEPCPSDVYEAEEVWNKAMTKAKGNRKGGGRWNGDRQKKGMKNLWPVGEEEKKEKTNEGRGGAVDGDRPEKAGKDAKNDDEGEGVARGDAPGGQEVAGDDAAKNDGAESAVLPAGNEDATSPRRSVPPASSLPPDDGGGRPEAKEPDDDGRLAPPPPATATPRTATGGGGGTAVPGVIVNAKDFEAKDFIVDAAASYRRPWLEGKEVNVNFCDRVTCPKEPPTCEEEGKTLQMPVGRICCPWCLDCSRATCPPRNEDRQCPDGAPPIVHEGECCERCAFTDGTPAGYGVNVRSFDSKTEEAQVAGRAASSASPKLPVDDPDETTAEPSGGEENACSQVQCAAVPTCPEGQVLREPDDDHCCDWCLPCSEMDCPYYACEREGKVAFVPPGECCIRCRSENANGGGEGNRRRLLRFVR